MQKEQLKAAKDEMDYEVVDNGVIEVPSSKPAAFDFVDDSTFAPEALEDELDEYDFGMHVRKAEQRDDGRFVCNFEVVTDHYKRVSVKMWKETVRIYPDEDPPDTYEFVRIVKSIEASFGELEHAPLDDSQ